MGPPFLKGIPLMLEYALTLALFAVACWLVGHIARHW